MAQLRSSISKRRGRISAKAAKLKSSTQDEATFREVSGQVSQIWSNWCKLMLQLSKLRELRHLNLISGEKSWIIAHSARSSPVKDAGSRSKIKSVMKHLGPPQLRQRNKPGSLLSNGSKASLSRFPIKATSSVWRLHMLSADPRTAIAAPSTLEHSRKFSSASAAHLCSKFLTPALLMLLQFQRSSEVKEGQTSATTLHMLSSARQPPNTNVFNSGRH
mmetsp:Transcript_64996/g.190150  ORF Transcript_64996/g.190150 Transcript_64996/m.190150 type:complete len:218 (-) Transcript_64996:1025-1678(-)